MSVMSSVSATLIYAHQFLCVFSIQWLIFAI